MQFLADYEFEDPFLKTSRRPKDKLTPRNRNKKIISV